MSDVPNPAKAAAQKGNDVSVLDELRAALVTAAAEAYDPKHKLATRYCIGLLDKFAADHPGLVDLSMCGPQCPAYKMLMGAERCMATFRIPSFEEDPDHDAVVNDAPTGQTCPVLAQRKETE